MKLLFYTFVLSLLTANIFGQATQAKLLANWRDNTLTPSAAYQNPYNEVWGFELNNVEYGVIGTTYGLHFLDLSDPTNPVERARVAGASQGAQIVHRDMKTHKGFLYAVCDEGASKLQIIDIHQLPNTVTQVYSSNEFVKTAHNLFIDTAQNMLYVVGESYSKTQILDISDPAHPVLKGTYPNANYPLPYVHDCYVRNNIGYMNCGSSGLWVVDFSNPSQPVTLGTMTNYAGAGYNHSGWLSEDGHYYYLCDETHGSPIKVVDVSDPSDLKVVATMSAESTTNQIPHNCLLRGNYLYASYYFDGLQVFDISDPLQPVRVRSYDSCTIPNNSGYAGAWGTHPLATSGNILLGDMQTGFWVFENVETQSGTESVENLNIRIFPNPPQEQLNITLDEIAGTEIRIELWASDGQKKRSMFFPKGQSSLMLPTNDLSNGIYFLKIHSGNCLAVHKVTVIH